MAFCQDKSILPKESALAQHLGSSSLGCLKRELRLWSTKWGKDELSWPSPAPPAAFPAWKLDWFHWKTPRNLDLWDSTVPAPTAQAGVVHKVSLKLSYPDPAQLLLQLFQPGNQMVSLENPQELGSQLLNTSQFPNTEHCPSSHCPDLEHCTKWV